MGTKKVNVMPVFGYIGDINVDELRVNKREVEEAFVLSLEKICDPTLFRFTQFRDGYTLPTFVGGKHKIWGLTAIITHLIMRALVPDAYKNKLVNLQTISKNSIASS